MCSSERKWARKLYEEIKKIEERKKSRHKYPEPTHKVRILNAWPFDLHSMVSGSMKPGDYVLSATPIGSKEATYQLVLERLEEENG